MLRAGAHVHPSSVCARARCILLLGVSATCTMRRAATCSGVNASGARLLPVYGCSMLKGYRTDSQCDGLPPLSLRRQLAHCAARSSRFRLGLSCPCRCECAGVTPSVFFESVGCCRPSICAAVPILFSSSMLGSSARMGARLRHRDTA